MKLFRLFLMLLGALISAASCDSSSQNPNPDPVPTMEKLANGYSAKFNKDIYRWILQEEDSYAMLIILADETGDEVIELKRMQDANGKLIVAVFRFFRLLMSDNTTEDQAELKNFRIYDAAWNDKTDTYFSAKETEKILVEARLAPAGGDGDFAMWQVRVFIPEKGNEFPVVQWPSFRSSFDVDIQADAVAKIIFSPEKNRFITEKISR
jgi:hypothetical protein